jgi:bisphosphoglycerate-dependent phosphoglycerate mutase
MRGDSFLVLLIVSFLPYRHYGDLVGKNKKETVKMFGKDQVKRWRRSYDEPPPPMPYHHEYHPAKDPRYRHVSRLVVCMVSV